MNKAAQRGAALAALLFSSASACGAITAEYMPWVRHFASQRNIDVKLLTSVIWVESRFCHYEPGTSHVRTSAAGARGLGQLMPGTAKEMNLNPDDPVQNIAGASLYLRRMYVLFGDWSLALAAYHAGPGNVRKAGGIPSWTTYDYVTQVLGTYVALQKIQLP